MAAKTVPLNLSLGSPAAGFKSAGSPSSAHFGVMRHFSSPLLLGPEPSEKLLSLIMHLFSDEEAELVQHLGPLRPRSAAKIASLSGRTKEEAERTLDFLAFVKRVILAYGTPRKYTLLPIVPGTFEMALMTHDLSTRNDWHRRFAELFENLWDEGYIVHYTKRVMPGIRYLPVSMASASLSSAWPSERLEEILAPYSDFAWATASAGSQWPWSKKDAAGLSKTASSWDRTLRGSLKGGSCGGLTRRRSWPLSVKPRNPAA